MYSKSILMRLNSIAIVYTFTVDIWNRHKYPKFESLFETHINRKAYIVS